jgi:hypothetical protein
MLIDSRVNVQIYTHDGARSKFSTNSHETDNSVNVKNTNIVVEKIVWISHLSTASLGGWWVIITAAQRQFTHTPKSYGRPALFS